MEKVRAGTVLSDGAAIMLVESATMINGSCFRMTILSPNSDGGFQNAMNGTWRNLRVEGAEQKTRTRLPT